MAGNVAEATDVPVRGRGFRLPFVIVGGFFAVCHDARFSTSAQPGGGGGSRGGDRVALIGSAGTLPRKEDLLRSEIHSCS